MNLKMIVDYKNNKLYRQSFNTLAGKTFGIDFERWHQFGFWNNRYICYSFLDGDRVVANVSANLLEWVVRGKKLNVVQIGTVMTHPDYRKKGLASQLLRHVLEVYENYSDLIYLFAEPNAKALYEGVGFFSVTETQFETKLTVSGKGTGHATKLDFSRASDLEIIRRLISEKAPLSSQFRVDHAEYLLAWHLLNVYPNDIVYVEELDAIVLFGLEGDKVQLYDVVARESIEIQHMLGFLVPEGDYHVIFHYTPDLPTSRINCRPYVTDDYIFYVKAKSEALPETFFHPITAHA